MPEALIIIGTVLVMILIVGGSIRAERRYKKWKTEHEIKSFDTR